MTGMSPTIAQFVSKSSSAGIVNVELGFVPDFIIGIFDIDGTNPNLRVWANDEKFSAWTAALSLLVTGSTGVITRDTTGIDAYDGNETIAATETVDTAGKHVDLGGTAASAGHVTSPGIAIPADHQTASGKNLIIAFRASV